MTAVILIGGLGTRLRPLTLETPKPLLPILNRPFLEYQLRRLRLAGIRDVVFCLAYRPEAFRRKIGNGRRYGIRARYCVESTPLGTGGAVGNARRYLRGTTLVLNGDMFFDFDLHRMAAFHRARRAVATIALTRVKDPTLYGLVETGRDGRIRRFLEKPTWEEVTTNTINAGVYLFEPSVLDRIPSGRAVSLERDVYPTLLKEGERLCGWVTSGYWLDIGTVEKYLQAHRDLLDGVHHVPPPGRQVRTGAWVGPGASLARDADVAGSRIVLGRGAKVESGVQAHGRVCIGDGAVIRQGAVLTDCVLLDHVEVGSGARVTGALLGSRCRIGENAVVRGGAALGPGTVIAPYSVA